jgi:hypothetical protein
VICAATNAITIGYYEPMVRFARSFARSFVGTVLETIGRKWQVIGRTRDPVLRNQWVAGLLVFVTIAAACSPTTTESVRPLPPRLEEMVANASQFQQDILADGVVTIAELETAVRAKVACEVESGVAVSDFSFDPDGGGYGMSVTWGAQPPTDSELASRDAIEERCMTEYSIVVEAVFGFQRQPTPLELAEKTERVAECMRQYGVDVPEGQTLAELGDVAGEDLRAYARCRSLAENLSK